MDTTGVEALRTTLAAEHAAVYVYGALGAQTSESGSPVLFASLREAYEVHRERRDHLTGLVADLGGAPEGAEPAYVLPEDLGSERAVTRAARALEDGCASTYASLVAETAGTERRWAIEALTDAAVRVLAFRGTPEMLPGADEYADR